MDEDHYGMPPDLRQFINNTTRPLFISPIPPPPPPQQQQQAEFMLSPPHHGGGRDLARSHHSYDVAMPPPSRGGFHHEFLAESAATPGAAGFGGLEMEAPGGGGNGRWPRQETLTLLEIRSRLDYKFKEANQKGPLWDEVSRIMSEEHGYERSGKKCREKFENLYKYYKKTKDGKGGRQDGKHYRFFRQLEALYGGDTCAASVSETHSTFRYNDDRNLGTLTAAINGNNPGALMMSADCSLSLSDSSDYDTSSSDDIIGGQGDEASAAGGKRRKGKGRWKGKIKEFIDGQMRKLMEKQEAWLEKIMKTIEKKEQERTAREEEWRRKEAARMETEQAFWANERAWIKARDSALMDALHKASNIAVAASSEATSEDDTWTEGEVSKLVQIRNSMGPRFDNHTHQNVVVVGGNNFYDDDDEALWEEIATKMSYLGYDRSGAMCREKWLHCINNNNYGMMNQCNKKRKDYNNPGGESCYYMDPDNGGGSYGNCPMEQQQQQQQKDMSVESCFRLLMGDHCETVWDNYGLKLNDRRN